MPAWRHAPSEREQARPQGDGKNGAATQLTREKLADRHGSQVQQRF